MSISKSIKYLLIAVYLVMLFYSSSAIGSTNYMIVFSLLVIPVAFKYNYLDRQASVLLMFSFFYLILTLLERDVNSKDVFGYLICPFSFFCFGKYMINKFSEPPYILELFLLLTVIAVSIVFYYY